MGASSDGDVCGSRGRPTMTTIRTSDTHARTLLFAKVSQGFATKSNTADDLYYRATSPMHTFNPCSFQRQKCKEFNPSVHWMLKRRVLF